MTHASSRSQPTPAPAGPLPSRLQSRRGFIQTSLGLLAAGWAGWAAQGVLFPPVKTEAKPVEIPLADLPVGANRPITYEGKPALVMRTSEGVTALSMICTHLGCIVQWQEGNQQFYCPCHDGRYDRDGDVVSGPPPIPLERLPVKLLGDKVIVGELAV
jgi:cytochrome b6-f complex iron-sulfur subunit